MESLVPGEKTALKVRKGALDLPETPGPLGSWARRASWVFLVCLATPDARVPRDPWAFLVFLEPVERREPGACLGNQDLGENGAPRVRGASGDLVVPLGNPELREHQVVMVPTGHPERGVSLDLRAPMDFLAPKALRALQGRTGCRDTPAREEKWDSKGRPAPQARPEWLDLREQLVKVVPWGREVTLAPQDLLESKDCLERLGRKGPRVILVPPGLQERTVLLV